MRRLTKYVICGITVALFLVPVSVTTASELVWVPLNPFFGGSSFNAQWLQASAEAQNKHIEKPAPYIAPNPMDDFQNSLNRALVSRLTTKILDQAFGEEVDNPLATGSYALPGYTIDIVTNGNITVNITDLITGNMTTVSVPYFP